MDIATLVSSCIQGVGEILADLKKRRLADIDADLLRLKRQALDDKLNIFKTKLAESVKQEKGRVEQDMISRGLGNSTARRTMLDAVDKRAEDAAANVFRDHTRAIEEIALLERRLAEENSNFRIVKDGVVWIIFVVAFLASLLIRGEPIKVSDYDSIAYTFGLFLGSLFFGAFPAGWVVSTIAWYLVSKTQRCARIAFALGAFGLVVAIAVNEHQLRERRAASVRDSGQRLVGEVRSRISGGPTRISSGLSAREAEETKRILGELRALVVEASQLGDRYRNELGAIMPPDVLEPDRLDTALEIASTKARLKRWRQLVDEYENDCSKSLSAYENRLSTLAISASAKEAAIRGWRRGNQEVLNAIRSRAALCREFAAEAEQLANFMQSRLGRFRVRNGTVVFDNGADASEYNATMSRIGQLGAREEQLIAQAAAISRESLEEMAQFFSYRESESALSEPVVERIARVRDAQESSSESITTLERKKLVEIQVLDFRARNERSGRTLLYDVSIYVITSARHEAVVKEIIESRNALIVDRLREIIAQSDPEILGGGSEPRLDTFRSFVKHQLDDIIGEGMIEEVLVLRCIPFRIDY